METPLQFLRGWLPFSRPPEPDKAAAEVREWLDSTTDVPAPKALASLATEIIPNIARHGDLPLRFKLLEEARGAADRALPAIEAEVEAAILPLPTAVMATALAADNVLKTLAIAYAGIAQAIGSQKRHASLDSLLEISTRRAIEAVCQRQQLAYRAYATPSASSWQMLHDLYRLARRQQIGSRNGAATPIEYLYAGALLLAWVDPGKFPRGSLGQVRASIDLLAPLASIGEATADFHVPKAPVGQFVIDREESGAGRPLARAQLTSTLVGNLIVDFRPVLAVLDQHLRQLPGDTPALPLKAPESYLRAMRAAIGSHAARRFSRTRFKPRADLVTGVDALIELLNGRALSRRFNDPPRHGQNWPLAISEWALLDESPEGYGIRYIKGEKTAIEAGEVVALQPRENSRVHICMVRRIASPQHHRLELGLQELSANGIVIDLPSALGRTQRQAILIPHLPGHGNCAGILARPGAMRTGQRVNFRDPERAVRYTIGAPLEKNAHVELFALDPVAG